MLYQEAPGIYCLEHLGNLKVESEFRKRFWISLGYQVHFFGPYIMPFEGIFCLNSVL